MFNKDISYDLSLEENISKIILENINKLSLKIDKNSHRFLSHLSHGNRKIYGFNYLLGRFAAQKIKQELLEQDIIRVERSLEKEVKVQAKYSIDKPFLPKELKRYQVQDKIYFTTNFHRFFYYFSLHKDKENFWDRFNKSFHHYCCFAYEKLAIELVNLMFDINSAQSFWMKNYEVDIFYQDSERFLIGEVKNNKKVCLSTLGELKEKSLKFMRKPDIYIIFSSNGYSKEMLKNKDALLLSLDNFKEFL